jgi:UPF0716 protein FxsA
MRFLFLAIVLAFPILDLLVTVRFARWSGVPVWLWLGLSVLGGFLLLRNERAAFRDNIVASMHGGQPLLRGLLDSGRKVLAGVLLLLPGVISDLLALLLLALPLNVGRDFGAASAGPGRAVRRPAIDGEYHRLD